MTGNSTQPRAVLAVNGGSSSLKLSPSSIPTRRLPEATLTTRNEQTEAEERIPLPVEDHAACVPQLWDWLGRNQAPAPGVISHRIVHGGMKFREPQRVTPELIADLRSITVFAPQHLPAQTDLLEAFAHHYPGVPQVVCFDTAFHRDMPRVAKLLPLPRRYDAQGVQRYGFHGISYGYLMRELERVAGTAAARGRVILAHLGNGASMAAVREGRSMDTTMGFTPAAGLVMSTRTGDLDPGLVGYLARTEGMTSEQFNELVNAQSGLLGVSETSPDTRDLLAREGGDPRAAEALELFCYQARKHIGALATTLNGLDTLVFSGGIGENSPALRARMTAGLEFLGIHLDRAANATNASVLSTAESRVTVRMIRTDEELCLAQLALGLNTSG